MAGEVIFAKLSQLEAFGTKVVTDFAALTARVQSLERAGGQPNIIEKILVNGIQLAVDGNKAVNFSVPTKTGELENDAGFQNGEDVDAKLEGKADSGHTHDDRYYTKAEDNGFLADKTGIVCSAKEPDARSILWLNTNWDGKQEDETQIMMLDIGDKEKHEGERQVYHLGSQGVPNRGQRYFVRYQERRKDVCNRPVRRWLCLRHNREFQGRTASGVWVCL